MTLHIQQLQRLFFFYFYFFFCYYAASTHFWAMASLLPGFQTVKFLWDENVNPMPHDQLPTWRVRVSLFVQYFTQNLSSIRSLLAALLPPEKLQQFHITAFIFKENTLTKHVYNCVQLHSNPNTTPSIFQTCIRKEFSSYTHVNKVILKKSISLDTGKFQFMPGLRFWKHHSNQTKNSHLKVFPGGQGTDLILYSVRLYH